MSGKKHTCTTSCKVTTSAVVALSEASGPRSPKITMITMIARIAKSARIAKIAEIAHLVGIFLIGVKRRATQASTRRVRAKTLAATTDLPASGR